MHLDLNQLQVESFQTLEPIAEPIAPADTIYAPCPYPETRDHPCTRQLTCVGCA